MSYTSTSLAGFILPPKPLFQVMSEAVQARLNCAAPDRTGNRESGAMTNPEWFERWTERLESLTREHMPSGSGFDCGTKIRLDESAPDKLIFETSFHHMDSYGGYNGWTEHRVTVRPSLSSGFKLSIGGRDRDGWKEYAYEAFDSALRVPIDRDLRAAPAREPSAFHCASVPGGWQSCESRSGLLFGPIHNAVNQLWEWQRANLIRESSI